MSQEYEVKVVRDGTTLTDAVVTEDVFIDSSSYTTTPVLQLFLDYDDTVPAVNRTPEYARVTSHARSRVLPSHCLLR